MKTILFSPVGGTDPISENNCRDGSLLHICRVYKPDKVILYMSKEMLEKHIQDNRYIYCLDRLAELQDRKMEYDIVKRPDLERVYEFDYFYKDFKAIIDRIIEKELDEDDEILINISSGTPAMKSGLAVLQTMIEFPCKLIQVTTPVKGMNEHTHSDCSIEELWEINEDNEADFENRCHEIHCPTLSEIKKEEMIKRHLRAYDYGAALDVAKTLPKERRSPYYNLIVMAHYRYLLNVKMVDKKIDTVPKDLFPVRSSEGRVLFEYALQIKIKMLRDEYADFVRAITPLIADLMENILKNQCHVSVKDYTYISKKRDKTTGKITGVREWDRKALTSTDILDILEESYEGYNSSFKYGPVYSDALVNLIMYKSSDTVLKKLIEEIRSVEKNIRNLAAHEIVSIDDNLIKSRTGFQVSDIMKKIQGLFGYTNIKPSKDDWNAYDRMNEYIISRI